MTHSGTCCTSPRHHPKGMEGRCPQPRTGDTPERILRHQLYSLDSSYAEIVSWSSPFTVSHSVGIVSMYSYSDRVKPYTFFWSCMTRKGSYATEHGQLPLPHSGIGESGLRLRRTPLTNIAEQLNLRLDTPIVVVILQQRMPEEVLGTISAALRSARWCGGPF